MNFQKVFKWGGPGGGGVTPNPKISLPIFGALFTMDERNAEKGGGVQSKKVISYFLTNLRYKVKFKLDYNINFQIQKSNYIFRAGHGNKECNCSSCVTTVQVCDDRVTTLVKWGGGWIWTLTQLQSLQSTNMGPHWAQNLNKTNCHVPSA